MERAELSASFDLAQVMDELSEPRTTHVHVRGNFENLGKRVEPALPDFLGNSSDFAQSPDRLSFARWLVDGRNPLTARVAVNRIWASFFGQGIVNTIDDFGIRRSTPGETALLHEFQSHRWC